MIYLLKMMGHQMDFSVIFNWEALKLYSFKNGGYLTDTDLYPICDKELEMPKKNECDGF